MTFYAYRANHTAPVGSYGPFTEIDDEYHFGDPSVRRLDATPEQEREAGWFNGPNCSNDRAAMVIRSLGYDGPIDGCMTFDPAELHARVTMARACPPVADDGMPGIQVGNMVTGSVRVGYFDDVYTGIAEVCEFAIAWQIDTIVCA